ncbi:MAG: BTAD domain-containing putative transcriptional regulator [Acidobacteriota bacterium]
MSCESFRCTFDPYRFDARRFQFDAHYGFESTSGRRQARDHFTQLFRLCGRYVVSRLEIRCLGGFEVRRGDTLVTGFESQKVRALFVYLLRHPDRVFSREHLATLLWPERSDDAARRNLRQAVYNLKSALAKVTDESPVATPRGGQLQRNPAFSCWVDVGAFEQALDRGHHDPQGLLDAVRLYRGDFLGTISPKDSDGFEEWARTERERLRDAAIQALSTLIDSYSARGEVRLGIEYARRLVDLDAYSEDAHSQLMRLYALSGRRSRALAQYQTLTELLASELGVEPSERTRALHASILAEQGSGNDEENVLAPLIPLVGRSDAYGHLEEAWRRVLSGQMRATLVLGPAGIGKTRLVRTVLDATGTKPLILPVHGDPDVPSPYAPLGEMVHSALSEESPRLDAIFSSLGAKLDVLSQLAPAIEALYPASPPPLLTIGVVADALIALLSRISRGNRPLVLFFDDLHWAPGETFEVLAELVDALTDKPVWLLATLDESQLEPDRLPGLLRDERLDRIVLDNLSPAAIDEIAVALVGTGQASPLGRLLIDQGGGSPLAIAEQVNHLWEEGTLSTRQSGQWRFEAPLAEITQGDLADVVSERLSRLPSSARRLAVLAAVIGMQFDTQLLQRAGDEHPRVVEVGLELMLERWLIRRHEPRWTTSHEGAEPVPWVEGLRRGRFEIVHPMLRKLIYESIPVGRRRVIHRDVARALASRDDSGDQARIAHHLRLAEAWSEAAPRMLAVATRAHRMGAIDTAFYWATQARDAYRRLSREHDVTTELEQCDRVLRDVILDAPAS